MDCYYATIRIAPQNTCVHCEIGDGMKSMAPQPELVQVPTESPACPNCGRSMTFFLGVPAYGGAPKLEAFRCVICLVALVLPPASDELLVLS
jgi:transposase-like protein